MKYEDQVRPDFGVSGWSHVFDKRRGKTRALNVWVLPGVGHDIGFTSPDLTIYVSAAGRVRVYRKKSGKTTVVK